MLLFYIFFKLIQSSDLQFHSMYLHQYVISQLKTSEPQSLLYRSTFLFNSLKVNIHVLKTMK